MQLKRTHGLVIAAVVAALCLRPLLRAPPTEVESVRRRSLRASSRKRNLAAEEAEEARAFERFLQRVSATSLEAEEIGEFAAAGDGGYDAAAAAGFRDDARTPTETERQDVRAPPNVAPYGLEDALAESRTWEFAFSIVIYDPERDAFVAYLDRRHKLRSANKKLFRALRGLTFVLRREFPERFCGAGCDELAIPVGGGDYPHVVPSKLPYADGRAPALMFGSAFRDPGLYPNMIAMPMPGQTHLDCFVGWAANGGTQVCSKLSNELVFGNDLRLDWEDLVVSISIEECLPFSSSQSFASLNWKHGAAMSLAMTHFTLWTLVPYTLNYCTPAYHQPQVTSRASDYSYLPTLQDKILSKLGSNNLAESRPDPSRLFGGDEPGADKRAVTQALEDAYDELVPRWKAAALTARAELDAGEDGRPWANVKLSYDAGHTRTTIGAEDYRLWESAGVAVGEVMGPSELATYRYQIDLAGGGGTTWTGRWMARTGGISCG